MKKVKTKAPPEHALPRDTGVLLGWIRFTNDFRRIEREIWYPGSPHRERNGEHCFQVALVAWFVRERFLPHLALTKILMYALVHDLVEVYAGDTPAFVSESAPVGSYHRHEDKQEREHRALERIMREYPDVAVWIERYEQKGDEESRLIYALDKFIAEANIYLDKGRTDKLLKASLEKKLAYKRPRVSAHPFVLTHLDALMAYIKEYRTDACYSAPT